MGSASRKCRFRLIRRPDRPHMALMRFREFWPHYQRLHAHPANRALHVAGTVAAVALLALAARRGKAWPVPAALALSYGAAWAGHLAFERNRPATFDHPFLSLAADLAMTGRFLAGRRR